MTSDKSKGSWPRSARSLWAGLGLCIAAADIALKKHMQDWLAGFDGIYEVTPFLNLVSVYNSGAAFGFLADAGTISQQTLTTVTFVMCVALYAFIMLYPRMDYRKAFIAVLLLGGGVGNAADRVIYGRVFDFIDVHVAGWHWPAFNLADMAISLSLLLMVLFVFQPDAPGKPKATPKPKQVSTASPEDE